MLKLTKKDKKRFFDKVKKTKGCWEWIGGKFQSGYGQFSLKNLMKKNWRTHRVSWIIHNGAIPKGMCVCHTCDNPACIRPDHLWLGTCKDNTQDMLKKGRSGRAKLTEKQIRLIRKIYRKGHTLTNTLRLSEKFGVRNGVICKIIHKQLWPNI